MAIIQRTATPITPPSIPPHQGEGGASTAFPAPSSPSPFWGGIKGGGGEATTAGSVLLSFPADLGAQS